MKKSWLMAAGLMLIISVAVLTGCNTDTNNESGFNLIFRYGVGAKNELDTFKGTYTRDMVMDPPVTVKLTLTEEELDSIYEKMIEIDFFDYLDDFSVPVNPGGVISIVTPYSSYYFKVEYDSTVKELQWDDEIQNENEQADKLRELIEFIKDIIESKEEYKKLPEPTSGYM